jgi:hypothetical protein
MRQMRLLLLIAMLATLLAPLAGCGRKNAPEPPEGVPQTYPRTYPHQES